MYSFFSCGDKKEKKFLYGKKRLQIRWKMNNEWKETGGL